MSEKAFKHNYDRQADNLARSAFEEPKLKSKAPDKPQEVDDYAPPMLTHFEREIGHKVTLSVFPARFGGRGGGRISFSVYAAEVLGLEDGKYVQFLYSPSKQEWVICLGEPGAKDSYMVHSNRRWMKPGTKKKLEYTINASSIAKLIFSSTNLEDRKAFSVPLSKKPDAKGRYFIVTRLAKYTGREKKTT